MTNDEITEWYQHHQRFDRQARAASERVLGRSGQVFVNSMERIATVLNRTPDSMSFEELATMRKLALATHAFNLLCSAWESMLVGRYGAAMAQRRSINETCELLDALLLEPSFAERMQGNQQDIKAARRIMRKGLKAQKQDPAAWLDRQQEEMKKIQAYSHVSFEALNAGFGVGFVDGERIRVIRPGGSPAHHSLKIVSAMLALDSVGLTTSSDVALGMPDVGVSEWMGELQDFGENALKRVNEELDELGNTGVTVDQLVYVRSDQEPPDPEHVQPIGEVMR